MTPEQDGIARLIPLLCYGAMGWVGLSCVIFLAARFTKPRKDYGKDSTPAYGATEITASYGGSCPVCIPNRDNCFTGYQPGTLAQADNMPIPVKIPGTEPIPVKGTIFEKR